MKHSILIIITVLLSVLMMPTAAFGASSDYTVESVNITADMRSDGSALITEEWTLTVAQDCKECFVRDIVVIDDNFERIASVTDVSVSLDGNTCTEETGESLEAGTYFYEKTENKYSVMWYIPEAGTHTFSIRYIQNDAVKIYKNRAYFYYRAVNEDSTLICRNVSVTVNTPKPCYPEDFEILESGNLAGEKADGSITFTASNTAGLVKIGITVPDELFNSSGLTVIVDDSRAKIAVTVILCVILAAVIGFGIYFAFDYKRVMLKLRLKMCKNKPVYEKFERVQRKAFASVSPATILYSVLEGVTNKSDYFTLTLLDLVSRGYITATSAGFTGSETSQTDTVKRPLDKNEKRVIRIFSSGKWEELITAPSVFYAEIEDFNKKLNIISPFTDLTAKGRKLISYCFELRLSAKRFEFVTPEEISDTIFKSGRYTATDLVISLINEYELSRDDDSEKPSADKFKYNMFMFRDVYSKGEQIETEKIREIQALKLKKKNGED